MEPCPVCKKYNLDANCNDIDTIIFYCCWCDIEFHAELVPDLKNAKRIYDWSKTKEGKKVCGG